MSHFYGTLQGARGEATRCGHKNSGMETYAASWNGAIRTVLFHEDGKDKFRVEMVEWRGSGKYRLLAIGEVGKPETVSVSIGA